jgi:transcriptional regulator with XRE-family HTH domain
MTKNGYTQRIVSSIQNANPELIGVQLGQICLAKGYSVVEVAEVVGVSRQTVYNWMIGRNEPNRKYAEQLRTLIAKLRLLTDA